MYMYIYQALNHVVRPNCALSKLSNTLNVLLLPILPRSPSPLAVPLWSWGDASLAARRATEETLAIAPANNISSTATAPRALCCSPLELGIPQSLHH